MFAGKGFRKQDRASGNRIWHHGKQDRTLGMELYFQGNKQLIRNK